MIDFGCHAGRCQYVNGAKSLKRLLPEAGKALLQLGFLLVHDVLDADDLGYNTGWMSELTADEKMDAKRRAHADIDVLRQLVPTMETLREDQVWARAWQALEPISWCKQGHAMELLIEWLETLTERQDTLQCAEALASSAAAELLAEEDRVAVKAASKKAKKLRQKHARQQQESEQIATAVEASAKASGVQGGDSASTSLQQQPATVSQTACSMSDHTDDINLRQLQLDHAVVTQCPAHDDSDSTLGLQHQHVHTTGSCTDSASTTLPRQAGQSVTQDAEVEESAGRQAFLQSLFFCPLTQRLMTDPVIAADGHTYERVAMTEWLQQHHSSPVTGQQLKHQRLVPNLAAKLAISAHLV